MIFELHQRFTALENALSQLQRMLFATQPKLWLPLSELETQYSNELTVLTGLISDLWYQDSEQDGRETSSRHGLVLANNEMIAIIQEINRLKDAFKAQVKKTRAELDSVTWLQEYGKLGNANLREGEFSRVHLKQCYRHIPLLDFRPEKVGFSWYAHGRSIKKISIQQAQDALLALGDHKTHIQIQLDKLAQLRTDTQLAQIQALAPVVRANLVFSASAPYRTKAMNASLPLFVPDTGAGLPTFNEISLTPPTDRSRKERADQKVDPEPFLPSIRTHLYRL